MDSAEKQSLTMGRKTVTVNGERFLVYPVLSVTLEEHLRRLRNMTIREDDVILLAFPKAGTHWLWEVVHMMTSGKVEYDSHTKEHYMPEFMDVERLEAAPSPRILNSHLFLRHLPKEIVTKRVRVLHVIRNPKDVAVSMYFHLRQRNYFKDEGFEPFARFFLDGLEIPGSYTDYFAYLPHIEEWQKEHPDVPFMNIYYEDMKEKPVECVNELAEFLGVSLSSSLREAIVHACSFEQLKEADLVKDNPLKDLFQGSTPQMYRKGEVGDWKNHFTVALNEQFDDVIAERLKGCSYLRHLRYTL